LISGAGRFPRSFLADARTDDLRASRRRSRLSPHLWDRRRAVAIGFAFSHPRSAGLSAIVRGRRLNTSERPGNFLLHDSRLFESCPTIKSAFIDIGRRSSMQGYFGPRAPRHLANQRFEFSRYACFRSECWAPGLGTDAPVRLLSPPPLRHADDKASRTAPRSTQYIGGAHRPRGRRDLRPGSVVIYKGFELVEHTAGVRNFRSRIRRFGEGTRVFHSLRTCQPSGLL